MTRVQEGGCEQFVEGADRLGLHRWEDVRVGVECDPDARVPEPLGDDLRVDALQEHQGRMGVAEVVEPDVREPLLPAEPVPAGGQRVGVNGATVASGNHEVVVIPRRVGTLFGCLIGAMPLEVGTQERR